MATCSFFSTSTKYYLYTSLLLVLSPPKSSESTMHIVRLVCTKSEILRRVPGCSAPLNGLSGCNRGLAWATREPRAKERQGAWQGQSDQPTRLHSAHLRPIACCQRVILGVWNRSWMSGMGAH